MMAVVAYRATPLELKYSFPLILPLSSLCPLLCVRASYRRVVVMELEGGGRVEGGKAFRGDVRGLL